jgi:hypothetical protein
MMFSPLIQKCMILMVVGLATMGALATPHAAIASGLPPTVPCVWPGVTLPGTVDACEKTPIFCISGTLCCGIAYPATISQNLFNNYRTTFVMDSFYKNTVTPDFKSTADQDRNVALLKVTLWGTFIDASILNDTLKDLHLLRTQSTQAYTPSEQICKIGTLSKALSASEARVDTDRLVLSEVGLAKNLGRTNSISAAGNGQENQARLRVFIDKFCDLKDNDNGLDEACKTAASTTVPDTQLNRDIDYTRLMGNGQTINADLTDANSTQDETNVIALSHFLYGNRQPTNRISSADLTEGSGREGLYGEYRSVVARRAAAQNSYNTLAAMKMAGSGGSETYMKDVLKYIGIDGNAADVYLGAKNSSNTAVNSSYNSQMNLLTKLIYQDPAFYANLMDSKTNVKRTSAALQGIGLMQQRDTYKSMARSEMLAALLVELEARQIANNVTGKKTE